MEENETRENPYNPKENVTSEDKFYFTTYDVLTAMVSHNKYSKELQPPNSFENRRTQRVHLISCSHCATVRRQQKVSRLSKLTGKAQR